MSAAVDPTCQAAGQAEAAARIADALIRNRLEPLPAIVIELLDALENGGLAIADLAQRIGRDPRLGARILQVVNSPFYGLPRRIADIGEAVMVLGIDSVRSIVVGASLGNRMHQAASAGFDVHRLLLHSFGSALGAQRLAARAGIAASTAFTACILHDIGKLAMHAFDADKFALLPSCDLVGNQARTAAERTALGADHGAVGAVLVRRWRLPPSIEHAVARHHAPDPDPPDALADLIRVADLLDEVRQIPDGAAKHHWLHLGPALARLRLDAATCMAEAGAIAAALVPLQELLAAG